MLPVPKAKAKAKAAPMPVPAAPVAVAVPAPIGRPAALQVEVLDTPVWFARMMVDIESAEEVLMGSLMLDHKDLTDLVLRRLADRYAFGATICVDREQLHARTCYHQRPRLDALRRAGAAVYACRGSPPAGAFHMKAVLIDRRYAYTGSANLTQKSLSNVELCMRIVGPPVEAIHQKLVHARDHGEQWLG
jgi:hypothetical protein